MGTVSDQDFQAWKRRNAEPKDGRTLMDLVDELIATAVSVGIDSVRGRENGNQRVPALRAAIEQRITELEA